MGAPHTGGYIIRVPSGRSDTASSSNQFSIRVTFFGELNLSRMLVRWGYYYPYRVNMGEHT
jgi:hypothetical protein|nr:hypothetical protein Q903MT_gene284 [Picea sitchensis]